VRVWRLIVAAVVTEENLLQNWSALPRVKALEAFYSIATACVHGVIALIRACLSDFRETGQSWSVCESLEESSYHSFRLISCDLISSQLIGGEATQLAVAATQIETRRKVVCRRLVRLVAATANWVATHGHSTEMN